MVISKAAIDQNLTNVRSLLDRARAKWPIHPGSIRMLYTRPDSLLYTRSALLGYNRDLYCVKTAIG